MDKVQNFVPADYAGLAKEVVPCACCGSERCLSAVKGDRYGFGFVTVVCAECGFIFTNPRPREEWFEQFYRQHYRHFYEGTLVPDQKYLERDWIRGRHSRNLDFLAPLLSSEGVLLDVGCAE